MTAARLLTVTVAAAALLGVSGVLTAVAARNGAGKVAANVVTLKEMKIIPTRTSVPSGPVTFVARNSGTVEHELVVIRADRRLTVRNFKAVEPEEAFVLGEVEDVAPGTTKRLTLTLKPGKYLLICNIVGHYQLGMSATMVAH